MFIEVYIIPVVNLNQPTVSSIADSNRRLISLRNIRSVKYSKKCKGRAEIEMSDCRILTVVGTYDEIINRMTKSVETNTVKRLR